MKLAAPDTSKGFDYQYLSGSHAAKSLSTKNANFNKERFSNPYNDAMVNSTTGPAMGHRRRSE